MDGFVGSLVVRRPVEQDPQGNKYDYDLPSHVIIIQDWLHEVADALYPGLRSRRVGQEPDTYLINGKGVYMVNFKAELKFFYWFAENKKLILFFNLDLY